MKRPSRAERRRLRGIRLAYTFALICIVGGLAGLPWALGYVANALASESWPTVRGEVEDWEIVQRRRRSASGGPARAGYEPSLRYSYSVDNQRYESAHIGFDFDATYNSRREAETAIASYISGEPVLVYYDPNNPANSALHPGGDWRTYRPLIFALAPLLLGGLIIVYRLRHDLCREIPESVTVAG